MTKHLRKLVKSFRGRLRDAWDTRRSRRAPLIKRAQDTGQRTLELASGELKGRETLEKDYADHPGRAAEAGLLQRRLRILTWVLILVSVPLQAVITNASWGLPWWIDLAIGGCLAVLIAVITENTCLWLSHKSDMPERAVKVCLTLAKVTGVVVVLSLVFLLVSRVASPELVGALHMMSIGAVALVVVAEGSAIVAGCLGAAAQWLNEPEVVAAEIRELRQLIAWINEQITGLDDEGKGAGSGSPIPVASILIAFLFAASQASSAQDVPVSRIDSSIVIVGGAAAGAPAITLTVPKPQAAPVPTRPRGPTSSILTVGKVCAFAFDNTMSIDTLGRRLALEVLAHSLPSFLAAAQCSTLMIAWVTTSLEWAPRSYFESPRGLSAENCDSVEVPRGTGLSSILISMRGFKENGRQQAQNLCRQEQHKRMAIAQASLDTLCSVFLTAPTPKGSRTGLVRVIQDVLASGDYSSLVLLSDGLENLAAMPVPTSIPVGLAATLVVAPARQEYGGQEASERAMEAWRVSFPGLRVVAYPEVAAPRFWEELTRSSSGPGAHVTCR